MTYFKRATVFLALGKSRSALPDLDKVVELKPDFTAVSPEPLGRSSWIRLSGHSLVYNKNRGHFSFLLEAIGIAITSADWNPQ